jgi:hypothetical protein
VAFEQLLARTSRFRVGETEAGLRHLRSLMVRRYIELPSFSTSQSNEIRRLPADPIPALDGFSTALTRLVSGPWSTPFGLFPLCC